MDQPLSNLPACHLFGCAVEVQVPGLESAVMLLEPVLEERGERRGERREADPAGDLQ